LNSAACRSPGQCLDVAQNETGRRNFGGLEKIANQKLIDAGFAVEYFAIRRAQNLEIPDRDCDDLVVLAGARLGEARLIDNVVVTV
jgi:pantoate--beta-alanine ligase